MYVVPLLFFVMPLRIVEIKKNSDYLNFSFIKHDCASAKKTTIFPLAYALSKQYGTCHFFFVHLSRNFLAKKLLET